nr:transmembrane protein 121B isoform X2 [Halyomorpha halys]
MASVLKTIILIFDGFCLTLILIAQETIINYYIIMRYKESVYPYFFFALDFLCVCTFVITYFLSFNNYKKFMRQDVVDGFNLRTGRPTKLPFQIGDSPFIYLSWLFYALIFVVKIVLIFENDSFIHGLSIKDHFGPQLLKVALCLSGFLFLLLVEGHNWKKRGSPQYSYITSVCAKTGIEIFDAVSMLATFMESKSDLSPAVKHLIISLSALNFVLPTIKLYQLSFNDFTKNNYSLPVTVIYMSLHVLFIDVPYLIIRLYLWLAFGENASIFLMKNALSIVFGMRGMYPDLREFHKSYIS